MGEGLPDPGPEPLAHPGPEPLAHPGTEASAAARRGVGDTAARILDMLAASPEPLGAYQVLDRLRSHGRYDPPTVYRALAWLVRHGRVHRLEMLKAYVARRSERDLPAGPARDTSALFIICDRCRSVGEIDDPGLSRLIGRRATAAMFTPRTGTIEILGVCGRCRNGGACDEGLGGEGDDRPGQSRTGALP